MNAWERRKMERGKGEREWVVEPHRETCTLLGIGEIRIGKERAVADIMEGTEREVISVSQNTHTHTRTCTHTHTLTVRQKRQM